MKTGRSLATVSALLALFALPGTAHATASVGIIEAYGNGSASVKYTYSCDPGSATTAGVLVVAQTNQGVANSYPGVTCDGAGHTAISGTSCVTSCNFVAGSSVRVTVSVAGVRDVRYLGLRPRP